MKASLTVLFALVFLTGCKEITGKLVVSQTLEILTTKQELVSIPIGTHDTKISIDDKKISGQIKVNRDRYNLEIGMSQNSQIPENGNFEIKSSFSGQPFDIVGKASASKTETALQRGREACQYYVQEPVCGPWGCSVQNVIKNGSRDIEFYEEVTLREIQFRILNVNDQKSLAKFEGSAEQREKFVTREGQCF